MQQQRKLTTNPIVFCYCR